MSSIYAIVTYHERPDEAAEYWKECGVCAIGWASRGDLRKVKRETLPLDLRDFLKIKKGDLILAYAGDNRIARVGEIKDGKYLHTSGNIVGRDEGNGGFEYPNQYEVKWWHKPYDFSRHDLPPFLRDQLGRRGKTVIPIDLERRTFDEVKQIIQVCARSGTLSYEINEDLIKVGIRKYLRRHLDSLEKGLRILRSEKSLGGTDRPDFVAEDEVGRTVIIECKGRAYSGDCEQLERYGRNLKKNARLMLIAFKIDDECLRLAKNAGIELFECDLKFNMVSS